MKQFKSTYLYILPYVILGCIIWFFTDVVTYIRAQNQSCTPDSSLYEFANVTSLLLVILIVPIAFAFLHVLYLWAKSTNFGALFFDRLTAVLSKLPVPKSKRAKTIIELSCIGLLVLFFLITIFLLFFGDPCKNS